MTEPNTAQYPDAPTVRLAGKEWPIPLLAIRQNRVVVPAILRVMKVVSNFKDVLVPDKPVDVERLFTEQVLDDLINATFTAVHRGHPSMSKAEFEDMPISPNELYGALDVLGAQCGVMEKRDAPSGEAVAQPSPTGTE